MVLLVILLIIIIAIKAIFSAADTAFTYINRAEIKQLSKTDKKAQKIKILMEDSNKFFGVIEVGTNLCELLASAIVSITVLEKLMRKLIDMQVRADIAIILSVAIITIVLAYIMLVFGGLLPKRIARNNPKKVAYKLTPIIWILSKINYPYERFIDFTTDFFSRAFNIKEEPEEKLTEKQLKMIIKEAKDEGVLESLEKRILMNTLKANDILVSKAMIHIEDAYLINIDDDIEKIQKDIKKYKYSRIPVYKKDINNIIGIFNIKDIASEFIATGLNDKKQIKKLLRDPIIIKEDEKIFTAFKKLQKENQFMVIVIDANNKTVGIITIEDILEKLVGKMFDENDKHD